MANKIVVSLLQYTRVHSYVYYVFTQPFYHKQDVTQDLIFKKSTVGWDSGFSFS